MNKIYIETSAGELIDKLTILEIKKEKIKDQKNLKIINKEYLSLKKSLDNTLKINNQINNLWNQLRDINLKLWEIEDAKRLAEKNKNFDENFIKLSRNVYKFNDQRAKIKFEINQLCGSDIKEIKQYTEY
tara:strand:- start:2108 stop:2497 length:390 start_codon:yes stop_codon:yes gene_type:complete